jgi:uncharacterized protein YqgC (DUF456 family)
MVAGLIGTIVPLVPGLLIVWVAGLVYGLVEGFGTLGGVAFAVMTVLLVMGSAASYVLPHRAGVLAGAGKGSLRLGIVGAVVGFFVIPVLGLPIGAVAGVWLGERLRLGDWREAWGTTRRVVVGFGLGALAEFGAGALMFATWLIWVALR